MKRVLIVIVAFIVAACAGLASVPIIEERAALRRHQMWPDTEKAYQWLAAAQRTNRVFFIFRTGLVPSLEKKDDCFVYDQALAALAFTHEGDYNRARLIFNFFDGVRKRHIDRYGEIWGFTDVYKRNGRETETRAAGPNAWMLLALNYYCVKTGDKQYLPLAEDIAGWLISLQSIEGGVIGGYYGNGKPMTWISTEHNLDCYAALRDLSLITGEKKYAEKAKEIAIWLRDEVWEPEMSRFYLGRRNPNYATDLSSWAVLSMGNEFAKSLDFAVDKSLNTQTYKVKGIQVEGFDFGSTYRTSPYPDKDAVWFEGTAQMALAFAKAERGKEAEYFMSQLDRCLTDSPAFAATSGLPYASNEGTPVYDSWLMQDEPLCASSTAWYYFAKKGFNPFSAFEDMDSSNGFIENLVYEPDYQFTPVVDDFEYSDIRFGTAYPDDEFILTKAHVSMERTDELAVDNGHSMSIEFMPDENAKTAHAAIRRRFLYPQDWSKYKALKLWVYSNGTIGHTNNIANLSVKDREGEMYNSPPIFLNKSGWTQYSFDIWKDFSRDQYDGVNYGDNIFGLSRVIEMSFVIRSKNPAERCRVYLDKIELER